MIQNKYKVKKIVNCIDCKEVKHLKLSINRFKCNVCCRILCKKHYQLGLEGGKKYYNINNYSMCNYCNWFYNKR